MMSIRDNNNERTGGSALLWTALALVGTAAVAYAVVKKVAHKVEAWDADALIEAADMAANNLDRILMSEAQVAS